MSGKGLPLRVLMSAIGMLVLIPNAALATSECEGWHIRKPEWIFCDDFEKPGPLVAQGRYFEHDNNKGDFQAVGGVGRNGSTGMRAIWQSAEVDAGNLKLGFGRVPGSYFSKGIRPEADYREVYYRMFVRLQKGWQGNPFKLSRAMVLVKADWSQAMIAHLWGDKSNGLQLDPARCTDAVGLVTCTGYNDFNHINWIGAKSGGTQIFNGFFDDQWLCVEAHVKLNDPGVANGVHEYWIGDSLEAKREALNFLGGYSAYGINGIFFENHWNSGSPRLQERYFDNIVVSTKRIGCAEKPNAPTSIPQNPDRGLLNPGVQGNLGRYGVARIRGMDGEWSLKGRKLRRKSPL